MARIIGIDYGLKRTGLAVTDPLKIIASPLETVPTHTLYQFLDKYMKEEEVESIVVGMPTDLFSKDTHTTQPVRNLIEKLKKRYPAISIYHEDERFTSKMALDAMIAGGSTKKDRRNKGNIDKISASIILQSFLEKQ